MQFVYEIKLEQNNMSVEPQRKNTCYSVNCYECEDSSHFEHMIPWSTDAPKKKACVLDFENVN